MIDKYGRNITYLRVSVTQRCNLNCSYCGSCNGNFNKELTAQQIEKIVRAFALKGISKVRLTGGEPLVRADICDIVSRVRSIEGIKTVALTTNGLKLKELAGPLKEAGITAINISLDTTDKNQYCEITGSDSLGKVFEGIDECERCGLHPIRLNAVLVKGRNDDQAENLIGIAKDRKIDVRFIELMPFSDEGDNMKLIVKGDEILSRFPFLKPVYRDGATDFEKNVARYYTADGFKGRVGLITPVSNKFCKECNRIRLLSDGKVKPCLGSEVVFDLMPFIDDEAALLSAVERAVLSKPLEHKFECGYGNNHGMNRIGG